MYNLSEGFYFPIFLVFKLKKFLDYKLRLLSPIANYVAYSNLLTLSLFVLQFFHLENKDTKMVLTLQILLLRLNELTQ
jgi:hypothetical protein